MERISQHITMLEATKSQTATRKGIINIPTDEDIKRMKLVADTCFEPLRVYFGVPIGISSFFRCEELNTAIGGSKTSQHRFGEAIDIDADMYGGITNKDIFDYLRYNVVFDQLIFEFRKPDGNPSWVHVSYTERSKNRGQVLEAYSENGRTKYKPYK